ncbi:hypothetical protein Tco_0056810 [Tanacetum coccineum]
MNESITRCRFRQMQSTNEREQIRKTDADSGRQIRTEVDEEQTHIRDIRTVVDEEQIQADNRQIQSRFQTDANRTEQQNQMQDQTVSDAEPGKIRQNHVQSIKCT